MNKFFIIICGAVVLATLIVGMARVVGVPAATAAASTPAPTGLLDFRLGRYGVGVAAIQQLLIDKGYFSGPVDGEFGMSTEAAVLAWQGANGLPQYGYLAGSISTTFPGLFTRVSAPFVPIQAGAPANLITAVQLFLMKTGYLNITAPTGAFGPATTAAVEAFQAAKGLPQTGVVDAVTFAAMNGQYGATAISDFKITVIPPARTIMPNTSTTFTITLTPIGTLNEAVNLTLAGLPADASDSFTSATATPPASVGLTIAAGAATGTYPLVITATEGSIIHTADLLLTVAIPTSPLQETNPLSSHP